MSLENLLQIDQQHIWHPYSKSPSNQPLFLVESAENVYLHLASGEKLIDGMSSWWSTIHGYSHPELNHAINNQVQSMSHVMFGGLTHEPAIHLAEKLIELTPSSLNKVFYSDSGSVSVEVAIKMAIQYWQSQGHSQKRKLLALRNGYHGDTFAAMSVCDPITGMHHLFESTLVKQFFSEAPRCKFSDAWQEEYIDDLRQTLEHNHESIAALILEPIVQGAGGMHFYSPEYLKRARQLCDEYNVLLIADEIATGFGRTGQLFACEHAEITPDIMCVGKALTGGYMTLAATLCTDEIASTICQGEAGVFMHGPTFMGNPLACATALASVNLLKKTDWHTQVSQIENQLIETLTPCRELPSVKDVRVLGAIGVVEMHQPVDLNQIQPLLVQHGIWLRPFGKLVYMMPPYIITEEQLSFLTEQLFRVLSVLDSNR